MKILRITNDIYPEVVGGIPLHVHHLSKDISNKGHQNTVLTCSSKREKLKVDYYCGYRVINHKTLFAPLGNSFAPMQLTSLIKMRDQYDIIHAHCHLFFSTMMASCVRNIGSSPLIITTHGIFSTSASDRFNRIYLKTISRWILKSADCVICYTPQEKEIFCKMLHVNSEKIAVIHNGIDTTLFYPNSSQKKEVRYQILWVGRFVKGKGVEYLIDAFSRVLKEIPGTHLVLVGTGPEKRAIEDRIIKLRLQSSVILIDYLDNAELPGIYKNSDVFVLPSLMEGVPRTILESMACGVPVVTTNLPHLVSIIDGAGLVVPPKEPTLLSNAILTILEDASLAEKMGQKGRHKIEQEYSWEDTVGKTLALYESVIANRQ